MITVEIDFEIFNEASKWEAEGTENGFGHCIKDLGIFP